MEANTQKLKKTNNRDAEMRYLHENRAFLEANLAGRWLALDGDKLLAVGDDAGFVKREAIAKGAVNPLITAVPRKEYQRRDFRNIINRTVRLVRDGQ